MLCSSLVQVKSLVPSQLQVPRRSIIDSPVTITVASALWTGQPSRVYYVSENYITFDEAIDVFYHRFRVPHQHGRVRKAISHPVCRLTFSCNISCISHRPLAALDLDTGRIFGTWGTFQIPCASIYIIDGFLQDRAFF